MLRRKKIGVVGAGNMGAALIRGWVQSQIIQSKNLRVADRKPGRIQALVEELGIVASSTREAIQESDIVLLAVKPQDFESLLTQHKELFHRDHLVISIAAGLRPESIENFLGGAIPVVRVMPNLPVVVHSGASAYSLGSYASWPHGMVANLLFSAVGQVAEVNDSQMDTVTALSGSGPAYAFLLAEMMTEAGTREGLPKEVAGYLSIHTIYGAAKMMIESDTEPAILREQVTSPGGTTAAALNQLENESIREVFHKGLHAARTRSEELSQGVSK